MDKKTELLVSLGASMAANCMPCFNYYYQQAQKLGLDPGDILQAMEIANKIKNSLGMLMGNHVRKTMELEEQDVFGALENTGRPCWEKP
ncbi:MAG: carboxymuconolactone decarboxylase family protein [Syntrophales bacterium]|nr:carboxymuconolactone decarboxylase family protein [Syntrophales bacterium]